MQTESYFHIVDISFIHVVIQSITSPTYLQESNYQQWQIECPQAWVTMKSSFKSPQFSFPIQWAINNDQDTED